MVVPAKKIWEANQKQALLFDQVFSGIYNIILFGGGIRGGKSVGCLKILYVLCKMFPGSRWAVVRESGPTLRRTTIPSFWQSCPYPFFHPDRFNKQELVATAANGSQILFIPESFNEDPELLRFGGLEINGGLCEEANELQRETFFKILERSGSWNIDPMPDPLLLATCNPHQGYLKDMFYTPYKEGKLKAPYLFIPALITDNAKNLSPKYLQNLELLKDTSPGLYRRMILGSWDAEDDLDQLIGWAYLYNAEKPFIPEKPRGIKSLGIDVGRHGPDSSVWTYMLDFNKEEVIKLPTTDGPKVVEITKQLIIKHEIPHDRVFMDTVGLGGFACDFLKKDNFNIQEFVAGATPIEEENGKPSRYANLKSQAAWQMKIGIEAGKAGKIDDELLRQDLAAQCYKIVGDKKIGLLPKDELKKKLKRSPDDGDSYLYAYWGQIYDTIEPTPDFFTT